MELLSVRRDRFRLAAFLAALHRFSVNNGGDGNPLPGAVDDLVYFDSVALAEALADDGQEIAEIPDDSRARLEAELTVFGLFTSFGGFDGIECADGSRLRVQAGEGADECLAFGFAISMVGGTLQIEGRGLSDVSGESELEPMVGQAGIAKRMRHWVRSFVTPKRGRKPE